MGTNACAAGLNVKDAADASSFPSISSSRDIQTPVATGASTLLNQRLPVKVTG